MQKIMVNVGLLLWSTYFAENQEPREVSKRLESSAFLCQGQGRVSIKYYGPVGGLKNMCFIISDRYTKQ